MTLRENGGRKTSIRRRRLALIKKQQVGFEQKMGFSFVAAKLKVSFKNCKASHQ
jgi:hypothetical protein